MDAALAIALAICTPSHGYTKPQHTAARDALLIHCLTTPILRDGQPVELRVSSHISEGARIDETRNILAERALEAGANYILWLDDDQTFPKDTFFRLLLHDLPMVGANIRVRNRPNEIVSSSSTLVNGELVRVEPKNEGLEEVALLGLGVCLMKADVFRQLPRPWFAMGPAGEDGHLCASLRARGLRPVVDHVLSMEVGHITDTVLRFSRD